MDLFQFIEKDAKQIDTVFIETTFDDRGAVPFTSEFNKYPSDT